MPWGLQALKSSRHEGFSPQLLEPPEVRMPRALPLLKSSFPKTVQTHPPRKKWLRWLKELRTEALVPWRLKDLNGSWHTYLMAVGLMAQCIVVNLYQQGGVGQFWEWYFFEIPWEAHLVRIWTKSLPNGTPRVHLAEECFPVWGHHLVRIQSYSLPDGAPRVFQKIQKIQRIQKIQKNQKASSPKLSKSTLLGRVLHYALCHQTYSHQVRMPQALQVLKSSRHEDFSPQLPEPPESLLMRRVDLDSVGNGDFWFFLIFWILWFFWIFWNTLGGPSGKDLN